MEESDLLRERLQAITEKHRLQGDIRLKKEELDREKVKLQHLKKKALREQWLLQDSPSHNASARSPWQRSLLSDQEQSRKLQLNIHRIEMEVESLEREECVISTNESFILRRLKVVEKSPQDIIKEAQDSFVPEPSHYIPITPDVPEANIYSEPNPPRKTLFAMEINVSKNLLTGESAVLSTASVPPEALHQHAGLKVYDDGRKSVYALHSQEGSRDQSCVSELSANEVEQLLRSATLHRQVNHQNYQQTQGREEESRFYKQQDERWRVEGCGFSNHRGHYGQLHILTHNTQERDDWHKTPGLEHRYANQEERHNRSNLMEAPHLGNQKGLDLHHGNHKDPPHSSYQLRHSVQEVRPTGCQTNGLIRSNSRLNGGRANGCPPPRSHDQEVASAHQPQLRYTPANGYIPLSDYISVDEEELSFNPASYHSLDGPPDTAPSPLYTDDAPYTILSTMDTTEPVTAIFMGFQTEEEDGAQAQLCEGSLKAELVILEDHEDTWDYSSMKEQSHTHPQANGYSTGGSANGEGRTGPGIKKIQRRHRPCCSVC